MFNANDGSMNGTCNTYVQKKVKLNRKEVL